MLKIDADICDILKNILKINQRLGFWKIQNTILTFKH